jgi:geranylgeranyl diphosphate synthase type II
MGALAGGAAERETALLGKLGEKLGHAFQIVDDLLDETGKSSALGKASGRDRARGKATYPRILGNEESRTRIRELGRTADEIAAEFGERGRALRALSRLVVERSS